MTGLQIRLAVMMFLQYAVWGVWAPILALHLGGLESFREDFGFKVNMIYLTMAVASMISPIISGQLADRYFATEKYLAFSHIMGGITLYWASQQTSFEMMFIVMLLHCFFYAPTVPLTNSLAFSNLPNGENDFGKVRVFGTIGWIVIGLLFSLWLGMPDEYKASLPKPPSVGDCLLFGAAVSIIMGVYCLTLPHTPPKPSKTNPFAFLGAIKLAKDRSFAVLLIVAFLVSTELQFYYVMTPTFFGDTSGPSLSDNELIKATGLEGENAKKQATLLIRELDLNRNRKLSKPEIEGAPDRMAELQGTAIAIQNKDGEIGEKDLTELISEAKLATADRPADKIAAYVIKAADGNGDNTINRNELKEFINDLQPVQPLIAKALVNFDSFATDKGGLTLPDQWVGRVMAIGQAAEIIVLLLLPFALRYFGFGVTIAIGIAAWAVRYAIFAMNDPTWLAIASQTLHGFGFGFFFVGTMIYADRIATADIRASAQSLIIFVTYGAGMVISSLIAGPVADYFEFNWRKIFLVPVAITVVCTILFLLFFREKKEEPKPAPTAE